ncbi:ABC-2 type transport system permease protein [Amycolatopsis arida]|uniref:ABC-2 type transport system permease protein n=1 Tax=Amycolatopsis arida TaxID=587909 RepID=A0A1I5PQ20_9PSEU|nr:ABC transporter permease subunit [Amycolatopsis arida]TDX98556.1 ABC-2 type transport system permease protein [Amycolatopsis arida]SFP35666.1 ABC-2 type transport system permease protein [Amycolatopsis arida]
MSVATMNQVEVEVAPSRAPLGRLLGAELRWIFRRPRTLAVLGVLAVIPVAVGIGLTLVDSPGAGAGDGGEGAALLAAVAANAFVLPIATLTLTLGLLLPLAVAMAGGDALAGESAHSTLRGWLLAPVSRGRLLAVKAFGVVVFALAAVLAVAMSALLTGLAINGTDALFTLSGGALDFGSALARIGLAVLWVTLQLAAVGAVALAISACTDHPMVVLASVLGGVVVFTLLGTLDALSWLHPFLLTESWRETLADVLRDPMPTGSLTEGALRAASYVVIALSLAYARVVTKDG